MPNIPPQKHNAKMNVHCSMTSGRPTPLHDDRPSLQHETARITEHTNMLKAYKRAYNYPQTENKLVAFLTSETILKNRIDFIIVPEIITSRKNTSINLVSK